jgi:hypothetical protein
MTQEAKKSRIMEALWSSKLLEKLSRATIL